MVKTTLQAFVLTAFAFFLAIHPAPAKAHLQTPAKSASKNVGAKPPTSQEIDDAKSKGMVWVNTSTRVYHKSDSSLYGKTKRGKFLSEDDAKKGGFRAANETGASKKNSTAGSK